MSIKGKAYIAGIYEHPLREGSGKTVPQLHAEVARGALADAGLHKNDIDAYYCAGDVPGMGGINQAEYMGLKLRQVDSTETGGSSYVLHVRHAAQAIAAGHCKVALITLAGRPRAVSLRTAPYPGFAPAPGASKVISGKYTVTNQATGAENFYRLRRP